jgi:flavodoxin
MKVKMNLFSLALIASMAVSCSQAQNKSIDTKENTQMNETLKQTKTLIAYYSLSGNTRTLAGLIQQATGAELFEIQTVEAYPSDYEGVLARGKEELNSHNYPKLKSNVDNLADYDVIFVGAPNWFSTIAPPLMAFLTSHDLSGKTVVPFVTHGTGGLANCEKDVVKLTPNSKHLEAFHVAGKAVGDAQSNVHTWLRKIGLMK